MLEQLDSVATPPAEQPLSIALTLEKDGPQVTAELVRESDLADAKSEVWLEHCLRKGRCDVPLDELEVMLRPTHKSADTVAACDGFEIGVSTPEGDRWHRFGIHALDRVAKRGERRLLSEGVLTEGQRYYYRVTTAEPTAVSRSGQPLVEMTVVTKRESLPYLKMQLAPLLGRGTMVGESLNDQRWPPTFITERAFLDAERFSRKGAWHDPPVETGAALVGSLCSCPETGEFFVIVLEAIELADSGTVASLFYSDETWGRIQKEIDRRRAHDPSCRDRMVGQTHGHNFRPHFGVNDKTCPECEKRSTCDLTSVFVSQSDLDWCRAVFCRQPWQLSLCFGLTARDEEAHGLFGLRDGRLAQRPFYLIDTFDPASC